MQMTYKCDFDGFIWHTIVARIGIIPLMNTEQAIVFNLSHMSNTLINRGVLVVSCLVTRLLVKYDYRKNGALNGVWYT